MSVLRLTLLSVVALFASGSSAFGLHVSVDVEEDVYTWIPSNNGSGPFWHGGCTALARVGDDVFAVEMDTGEDVPPLCNTRWRLHKRGAAGWEVFAEASQYRQREPGVLAVTGQGTLNLYINDSVLVPGAEYLACVPHVIRFDAVSAVPRMALVHPQWEGPTVFTDHSYRGFASDRHAEELLMLNINAETSGQHYAHIGRHGETLAAGVIHFPIRACYPDVALRNGAAHVLAIGDIVEPVEEWRAFKSEVTGQAWDYVFRRLFYTWSPDLRETGFAEPLEIANVDDTAGYIRNQDLWIAPDGTAYFLYTEQEVQSAAMRDRFFPDASLIPSLHLVSIKDGAISGRRVLVEGLPSRHVTTARFHESHDGRLFAVLHLGGADGGNVIGTVDLAGGEFSPVPIPFDAPFGTFSLANARSGNAPSNTIDLIGQRGLVVSYARIMINDLS